MLPTPIFRPGEFHGLYSPRGSKELDTTERFSLVLYSGFPGGTRDVVQFLGQEDLLE